MAELNPNIPMSVRALDLGQAGQNFDDVPEAMAPETSNEKFFMLLRSETNKRNEELKKAKTELEGEIERAAAAGTIFQGRLAKGMLVGKDFKDATEAITKSREIIKGKELELRPVLKELEQMERRRDYVNRLTRGEAMIPFKSEFEKLEKLIGGTGDQPIPNIIINYNAVGGTTVTDASTATNISGSSGGTGLGTSGTAYGYIL